MSPPNTEPETGTSAPDPSPLETRSLDRALVGGFAWTAGAKWLSQLITWPSVLITARLLSPDDYGLVEMAGFYFLVTNVMAEFGIGMAVLQMRELDRAVTAQLNTISAISGVVFFLLSVALAPLIAAFFKTPALNQLVVVASVSFVLISVEAIPLGLLQRDMDFRRLSVAESVQAVLSAFISVACAFAGMGYWALIVGPIVGRAANIGLVISWRPSPFAWPHLKQVTAPLRFGMEIAVQRAANTVNGLSDVMVIGRTMGKAPLGVYRLASNLASTPSEKISTLIMRVTGPLFARVQGDKGVILRYYLIFTETLAMTASPLLFGLAVVAPEAVPLLLGPQWAGASAPLRWLAIFMAVRTLSYLSSQLLLTLRFTRFGMWMSFLNFALMPVAFYIASKWGVGAVAASWLIVSPITVLPIIVKVHREIGCGLAQYFDALLPAIVGCAGMLAAIFGLRRSIAPHGWPGLIAEVALGGAAYSAVLWLVYRQRVMRFVRFFRDLRRAPATAAV
jgi:O-antigen/teichoic acid export membrane protein